MSRVDSATEKASEMGRADGELDLGALSRGIARNKRWVVLATLLAFGLAYLFVMVVKPRYTAESKVLVESGESYFTRPDKEAPQQPATLDPEAIESQVQLVTSRDLARKAIRQLRLMGNPEFDPLAGGLSPVSRVLVLLGLQRDPAKMTPEDRVLETYNDRLVVYAVAKTRVLSIQFTSENPDLAAKAANTISALYLDMQEDAKKANAKAASAWLAPQIEVLRAKVAEADGKVEAYRARTGLLVGTNNTIYTAQQLSDLSTQLSAARAAAADRSAKAKLIRDMMREGRVFEVSDVANNELIRQIAQQRVTLRGQLALESRTLLPGHPRIQELTAQLADVDRAMRSAADKTARGLENDARIAKSRVAELTEFVDSQKSTVATGNGDEVELRALQRDAASARDQLESFMQKYRAAVARDNANATPADARVISRAFAPQLPSFPKVVPTLVIVTLAGLFLSLALVTTRELLSRRAFGPVGRARDAWGDQLVDESSRERNALDHDAPSRPTVVPMARPSAPAAMDATLAQALHGSDAPAGEGEVAALAQKLVIAKPVGKACCIVVCGVDRDSGATPAAIELARDLASGGRAIAVDFDQDGPGLGSFIAGSDAPGLSDLVEGHNSFAETIHRDAESRLHILPAGRVGDDDPLSAEEEETRLDTVMDALVATYDYIVLVGQPLATSDLSLQFAEWTDAVVLVTAAPDHANDAETHVATDRLRSACDAAHVHILSNPDVAKTAAADLSRTAA